MISWFVLGVFFRDSVTGEGEGWDYSFNTNYKVYFWIEDYQETVAFIRCFLVEEITTNEAMIYSIYITLVCWLTS